MQIQKISNNFQQTNFKASLYNYDGTQIKEFNGTDKINSMSERGNKNTRIGVMDFISQKTKTNGYKNFVRINVTNPLFGEDETFLYPLQHTSTPIKGNKEMEMQQLDLLTGEKSGYCKELENTAFKKFLVDSLKEIIITDPNKELNPIKIFEERYNNLVKEKLGFSEKRIGEFRKIAQDMLNHFIRKSLG